MSCCAGHNTDELRTTTNRILPWVDFELPVQDVTFVRNEHLNTRYSLETLLNEASGIKLEDPSKKDHTACVAISGQSQLDGAELGLLVQIDSDDDTLGSPILNAKLKI
ncbi:hypothetical protein FRX31_006398 [Thalictrum thalictroides]|uniref:Uncharacterized protein n=1 Tax=Thalictrum thalictroides TaxID=46969 RepID=A0A7J6X2X3_THATH|nr:hypothetical protein FRX31_006398 [Thalictrum thalictroides]